jgi:Zn-dependent protease with chaperone function
MQLAILIAVLGAIAVAESGGGPVTGLAWRLAAVAGSVSVAPLVAFVAARKIVQSSPAAAERVWSAQRLQQRLIWVWLGSVACTLFIGQWPRIVRGNWQLAGWPLVDEIAILTPVVAPLILLWAALYRLEFCTPSARHEHTSALPPSLLAYLTFQVRQHLALVLLPPLAVVGLIESLSALKLCPSGGAVWWFVVPLIAMVLVVMPLAVRSLWRTTPLVGMPLRKILDQTCHDRHASVREILVWQTNGSLANAAVVGFSRGLRYLLLTDVLLCHLSDSQVTAVVRHELAHLRRHHLLLRLALLLLPVAAWIALQPVLSSGLQFQRFAPLALPLLLLAHVTFVVGWYSRFLEHDADLDACLNDSGQYDHSAAIDFCSALVLLCGSSDEGVLGRWLHPTTAARVMLLHGVALQPQRAVRLRQQKSLITAAIGLLYAGIALIAFASGQFSFFR